MFHLNFFRTVFLLLVALPVWAQSSGGLGKIQFEVERFRLDNGLTVLLHEDRSVPLISFHQWFRVGSRNERVGETGITHMLEHMMFKGSTRFSGKDLDRLLQANGIMNNAFTTHDYTGYYENLPSDKLELVIDMESDRMQGLLLKDEDLKSELQVVGEERRWRVDNSVDGFLFENLYSLAYKVHPYTWPVIGWMKDIQAYTTDKLRKYYLEHYAPNNAVVVIVGDFDKHTAKKLVLKYYSKKKAQLLPDVKLPPEPAQKSARYQEVKKEASVPSFADGYVISAAGEEDSYALDLLSNILGEGASSRLYRILVYERQMAKSVSVYSYTPKDPGLLQVSVEMKPGRNIQAAMNIVDAEIAKLQQELVSAKELEKVKNQIVKDYVDGYKSIDGKARILAWAETVLGDYTKVFSDLEQYEKVTPEKVREVARKYLTPERRNRVRLVPQKGA